MEKFQTTIAPFISCFDAFVNYIHKKGSLEAAASGNPKTTDCYEINELFAENEKQWHIKPKTPYLSFTFVRYLFEVSYAINLLTKEENAKGKLSIKLDKEALEKYEMMDSEEKYLSFLQGFWCRLAYDFREYSANSLGGLIKFMLFALENPTKTKYEFDNGRPYWQRENSPYKETWFDDGQFLELFANLGFWDLEKDATIIPKDKYDRSNLKSLTFQEQGVEIFKILAQKLPISLCNKSINSFFGFSFFEELQAVGNKDDEDYLDTLATHYPHFDFEGRHPILKDPFESFFKDLFPHAEVVLGAGKKPNRIEGNFYFKVSLNHIKSVYRIIALHSSEVMHELHLAIQDAFDFADDHLYLFSMDMKGYHSSHIIDCPLSHDNGNEFANEVMIGSLPWESKHKFLYIFDFGYSWEFVCQLQKIDNSEEPLQAYKIVETVGKAPKQHKD